MSNERLTDEVAAGVSEINAALARLERAVDELREAAKRREGCGCGRAADPASAAGDAAPADGPRLMLAAATVPGPGEDREAIRASLAHVGPVIFPDEEGYPTTLSFLNAVKESGLAAGGWSGTVSDLVAEMAMVGASLAFAGLAPRPADVATRCLRTLERCMPGNVSSRVERGCIVWDVIL